MGRQLFLHHYLPAHLASALVTGALVEFIFNVEPLEVDPQIEASSTNIPKKKSDTASTVAVTTRPRSGSSLPVRERIRTQSLLGAWAATGVILSLLMWGFWYFAPLTYGKPGLDVDQVVARKWLSYDLHFAK
jgi:dolichyl-phosphate-mannose-protein mannosyltransferase